MLRQTKKVTLAFILAQLVLISGAGAAFSATGSASFSASGGTFPPSSTFSTTISENSGTQKVYAAGVCVAYSSAQLQFVNASGASGVLFINGSTSSDSIYFSASPTPTNFQPFTGTRQLAVLTFKALDGVSSATISFCQGGGPKSNTPAGIFDSSGNDIWDHNSSPTTFNFVTPAPAATTQNPVQSAGSSNNSSSSGPSPANQKILGTGLTAKLPAKPIPVTATAPEGGNASLSWAVFWVGWAVVVLALLARWFSIHHKILARARQVRGIIVSKKELPVSALTPISALSPTDRPNILAYRFSSTLRSIGRWFRS